MKKILSKVFTLVICTLLSVLTLNTTSVKADLLSTEYFDLNDQFEQKVVYYLGIAPHSSTKQYGVLRSVDQRYYKNERQSLLYNSNTGRSTYLRNSFAGLRYSTMCLSYSQYCTPQRDEVNDPLVEVAMSYEGDIRIYLKDGYSISNFRIYYIIPTYVDSNSEAYCDQIGTICEGAKAIQGSESNWKNVGRGQNLVYNQNSIDSMMEKKEKKIGTNKETLVGYYYSGYNIFDKIPTDYKKMAEIEGAYVTYSITVTNGNGVYYSANNSVINNSNPYLGFYLVDDIPYNDRKYYSSNVCSDARIECMEESRSISSFAGLVKPPESSEVGANASYSELNEFFITTLKPIIMIVVGIMFVVSGSITGITIIRSSDEPEVRRESIKKLIGLFTGALIIEGILLFYEPIIQFFSGLL